MSHVIEKVASEKLCFQKYVSFSTIRRGIKESNIFLLATLSIEFTHFIFPVSSKVSLSGSDSSDDSHNPLGSDSSSSSSGSLSVNQSESSESSSDNREWTAGLNILWESFPACLKEHEKS